MLMIEMLNVRNSIFFRSHLVNGGSIGSQLANERQREREKDQESRIKYALVKITNKTNGILLVWEPIIQREWATFQMKIIGFEFFLPFRILMHKSMDQMIFHAFRMKKSTNSCHMLIWICGAHCILYARVKKALDFFLIELFWMSVFKCSVFGFTRSPTQFPWSIKMWFWNKNRHMNIFKRWNKVTHNWYQIIILGWTCINFGSQFMIRYARVCVGAINNDIIWFRKCYSFVSIVCSLNGRGSDRESISND